MTITGDISDKEIAPILLLTFVENAFKHGANKNIGIVNIDINFTIIKNYLYFTVTNPLPSAVAIKSNLDNSSGIGLENVKKRLTLGYKQTDYDLKISSDDNKFTVALKIKVD